MHDLIDDICGCPSADDFESQTNDDDLEELKNEPNPDAKNFFNLLEDVGKELNPGCEKHSKHSLLVYLFYIKCVGS